MRAKILVLAGVLVTGAAIASGQSQRQAATLDDVVAELRGLRADLKAMRASTTEAQMLTARLQLQEQRIAVLSNQRNDVSTRLAIETRLRTDAERQVQVFEETRNRNEDLGVSRAELEGQAKVFKSMFEMHRDLEQQLRAQDTQLSGEIANEQNRWQDFNNRLDELERSLK
jgi:chromosome segregation ATPase